MGYELLKAMDDNELKAVAPAIFAGNPMPGVSGKYSFIPTIDIVRGMRKEGWVPVSAKQNRVRSFGRQGYQKHGLRFQRASDIETARETRPEVLLINSHDMGTAYQLHAGFFRMICSNGMVVADGTFAHITIKHVHFDPATVIEGSYKILSGIPQIEQSLDVFKSRQLSEPERLSFASAALLLKYETLEQAPVRPEVMLTTQRSEDRGNDLWRTFNVVQENLIRGGIKDWDKRMPSGKSARRTMEVKSISESVRLNKGLWDLAEAFKTPELATV